jgi:hypothetical protein
MKATNAINVPLASDIKGLLADYFARRPPFSDKKRFEFPDAISIASIRASKADVPPTLSPKTLI